MEARSIEVRTAALPDVAFIARAQQAMAQETEGITLELGTVQAGVRSLIEHPQRGFYLLAIQADRACGCVLVLSEWSDWRNREVWWLHSVYVEPEMRGEGVFRALFIDVERLAREAGVAGLRLYVDKRNARAQAVYRGLGMTNEHYELFERML